MKSPQDLIVMKCLVVSDHRRESRSCYPENNRSRYKYKKTSLSKTGYAPLIADLPEHFPRQALAIQRDL